MLTVGAIHWWRVPRPYDGGDFFASVIVPALCALAIGATVTRPYMRRHDDKG